MSLDQKRTCVWSFLLAAARTESLIASGVQSPVALNGGYHVAFVIGAVFAGAFSAVTTAV